MYLVNHFLDVDILGILVPDRIHAPRTNAVRGFGSIGDQCESCLSQTGRMPNVVLVDFVDQGSVIEAQSVLNNAYDFDEEGFGIGLDGKWYELMIFWFVFLVWFFWVFWRIWKIHYRGHGGVDVGFISLV